MTEIYDKLSSGSNLVSPELFLKGRGFKTGNMNEKLGGLCQSRK